MKKSRITSFLTAIALTAVSTVPMVSSAYTIADIPEIPAKLINDFCGENVYIEKFENDIYYCLGENRMVTVKLHTPYMSVKLKKSSVLDLDEIIQQYGLVCTGTDEYGFKTIAASDELNASREELMNKIFPETAEILSQYEDVLKIKKECWAGEDDAIPYAGIVIKGATLNAEDYPEFVITENDDSVKLIRKSYYKTLADDYKGAPMLLNYYYDDFYTTYMSLIEQYGDENVYLELPDPDYEKLEEPSIGTGDVLYVFIEPVPETGYMEDIISYYEGKDAYIERSSDNKSVSIITEYSSDIFEKSNDALYITVKKGTELSAEEIGLPQLTLKKVNDTTYWIKGRYSGDELLKQVSACEKVVSFDEGYQITRLDFSVYALAIESDMTDEEILEKYPYLEKIESDTESRTYTYNGSNIYLALKELQNDDAIKVSTMKMIPEIIPPRFSPALDEPFTRNLYTAEIKGDVTVNGVLDIADVVAAAAYVSDPDNNVVEPQGLKNGDVHNTGDGLTGNDVLAIQQYLKES